MRIAITGATGTIGRALTRALLERGDTVVALSRNERKARESLGPAPEIHAWPRPADAPPPAEALRGADAVVNLIGETVAQRWTAEAKQRIRSSRVETTRSLVEGLRALPDGERPAVLVSQSAAGYYGASDERPLAESASPGSDFLAGVVVDWEAAAHAAGDLMRIVTTRTGLVLSPSGGALARMLPFFRVGIGGPVAGGHQYVPWVHLDDMVGALIHCLERDEVSGPVNLVAPGPVTNAELSRALGRALHRPAFLPVPGFALKLLYGEMAEIIITGQRAVPTVLESSGYRFRQPDLAAALADVLGHA